MLEGRIKVYFADKGFGFIQVANMKDVFFHIDDMPQKHIEPKPNERVQFDVIVFKGKEKAFNIFRLDLPLNNDDRKNKQEYHTTISREPKRYEKQKKSSLLSKIAIPAIIILFVPLATLLFREQDTTAVQIASYTATQPQTLTSSQSQSSSLQFTCDGRQHCSQMNSLEEARYFVKHCPDTKMDGDNDGEPCENDSRWR